MFPRLRSLNVLVLAGFVLVSIPLIAAIVLTRTYADALAGQTVATISDSVRAARDTQLLLERLATVERIALQFRVVGTPDLLALYRSRHEQLLEVLERRRHVSAETERIAEEIEHNAAAVLAALTTVRHDSPETAAALARFERMHAAARELKAVIDRSIDASLADLQARSDVLQRTLYWQAAALIPLAIALAALFTILIVRPIRQLGDAIRRLGEAGLDTPVSVRGPLDIEELGRKLDWLRHELSQIERQKSTFLSHVSHELKTPLANIREGADLLLDGSTGSLSPEQQHVAAIVRDNSVNLQKKIEDLLNFNVWRNNETRLQYTELDLHELVREVLERHRLPARRLGLRFETDLQITRIRADKNKLGIVLDNAISNAVKFSPPGGRILILSKQVGGGVELHICDEGPGVSPEERERVFEPFYQGSHRQRGHVSGTGIGLSIVRTLVRAHGGRVELTEGVTSGANLKIFLPQQAPA